MNIENIGIVTIIVEDDQSLCKEAAAAIAKTVDIKLANITDNAATAVEMIKQYAPDVVVLDLLLGDGGDGDDVLKEIRSLGTSILQPGVAVLTDNRNKNLYSYYTEYGGADTYFIKSMNFNGAEVVDRIRKTYDIVKRKGVNMPDGSRNTGRARPESPIEKIRKLEDAISARLEKDGMYTDRCTGKMYLIDLIVLAVQNGGISNYVLKENEQIVAQKRKTTASKVSRNVTTAIHRAYDFLTTSACGLKETPFLRDEKLRTPYSIISYYSEVFRNGLD